MGWFCGVLGLTMRVDVRCLRFILNSGDNKCRLDVLTGLIGDASKSKFNKGEGSICSELLSVDSRRYEDFLLKGLKIPFEELFIILISSHNSKFNFLLTFTLLLFLVIFNFILVFHFYENVYDFTVQQLGVN